MLDAITPSEVREAQRFINQQLLLRRRNSPDLMRGSRSLQVMDSHNITTTEVHVHHPGTLERFTSTFIPYQRTDNQRMKRLQTEDLPDQRGPRTFGQTDTEVNDVAGSNPTSPCSSDACLMAQTASISDVSKDDEEDNRHSSTSDTNLSNIFKVKSPVNVPRRPQQL